MAKDTRHTSRIATRDDSRALRRRVIRTLRAVDRAATRNDGATLTRAAAEVEAIAREFVMEGRGSSPSLEGDVARRVVELAVLDGVKGLRRTAQEGSAPAAAPEAESNEATSPLQAWYEELQGQGLSEPEIREHMAARVRAERRRTLEESATRRVGR